MNNKKENIKKNNSEENKDPITHLEDNELGENVAGGDSPDHRPMPLYGVRPRPPITILKYGIEKPYEPEKPKEGEKLPDDKKESPKEPEIKPLDP